MTTFSPTVATAETETAKDCATLRIENGWDRAKYRECRRAEVQANIDRLNADFAEMRDWLRARGLDVNEAGHITDPEGRTLAQIEASNAALAAGNADLAAGNAALRAEIKNARLRIKTANEEYQRILREFERSILQSQ